jgi:hypothetical protein
VRPGDSSEWRSISSCGTLGNRLVLQPSVLPFAKSFTYFIDLTRTFQRANSRLVKVPDINQSQQLMFAGALMRQVFMNIHRAYHAILLRHGMDQATLNVWSEKVEKGKPIFHFWLGNHKYCNTLTVYPPSRTD